MRVGHRVEASRLIGPQITIDGVHVWPFEDSFPIDVTSLTFNSKTCLRLNRHDYFELLYVQTGDMVWQFHDQYAPLKKGNLLIVNSTYYHGPINSNGFRCNSKALALYFMPELLRTSDSAIEDVEYLAPFLWQADPFPFILRSEEAPELVSDIVRLMTGIEELLPAQSSRSRLTVKTYLKMALIHLINFFAESGGIPRSDIKRQKIIEQLKPLFEFLEHNYTEPISVEDASRILNMSRSCFMRFFKKATGQSFVRYLNRFKIAKAQEFLAYTDDSISEISQNVGFCDQSYFGLVFRKTVNMTPVQYRQKMRESLAEENTGRIREYGSIRFDTADQQLSSSGISGRNLLDQTVISAAP